MPLDGPVGVAKYRLGQRRLSGWPAGRVVVVERTDQSLADLRLLKAEHLEAALPTTTTWSWGAAPSGPGGCGPNQVGLPSGISPLREDDPDLLIRTSVIAVG